MTGFALEEVCRAPAIEVFNKWDRLDGGERTRVEALYPTALCVSALTGEGREEVIAAMETKLALDTAIFPMFGGVGSNISPCAFWPNQPIERPIATRLIIECVDRGLDGPLSQGIDVEIRAFLETLRTEYAAEGIQAFFQKRKPDFSKF